jgi:hypothetical protein
MRRAFGDEYNFGKENNALGDEYKYGGDNTYIEKTSQLEDLI